MSASEKLKALDEAMSDAAVGFIMGVDDDTPSEWPPNIRLLMQLRDALPQIVAVVKAAERAEPAMAQGERAMEELVWTHRDVTVRDALIAALAALDKALS